MTGSSLGGHEKVTSAVEWNRREECAGRKLRYIPEASEHWSNDMQIVHLCVVNKIKSLGV